MSNLSKWADEQQFVARPMAAVTDDSGLVIPKVSVLSMTPDPLGAVAAMCRMYVGEPTYDLADISDADRLRYFRQVQKTHLKAPLEAIKIHFFIEGVTRSFTHQMVRQRTAVYSQESLRFAVKEQLADEVSLPPSIAALPKRDLKRQAWDEAIQKVSEVYNYLVGNGIPAEDARGLMPHCVTTRLNYITDLRNLSEHAGNRLCTQAQFEWRIVFMGIVEAIKEYGATHDHANRWQYDAIANSGLFRPICYQLGRCQFMADFDRDCTIRDRVESFAEYGVKSDEWGEAHECGTARVLVRGIDNREWLMDPAAARRTSGGGGHE